EERLPEPLGQPLRDEARDEVGAAAGGGRNQDADWARRIRLGDSGARCRWQRGKTEQEFTALHECCHPRMLPSEVRPRRSLHSLTGPWEQTVGGQKLDHVAVEQRRLLDLAGMAGAVEDLQFAAGDALLQGEGGPMRVVLATGEDDGWTGDLGVMALGLGPPIGLELGDDGANIAEQVAIG